MRDIVEPIRVAYNTALTQIVGVPVFYQGVPDGLVLDNYMVFRSINQNDASTKHSAEVDLNITVEIHTRSNKGNAGLSADAIADEVYQLIYPNKQTNLTLSRGQIIWTRIANERVDNITLRSQSAYIDRYITFAHRIAVDVTGAGGGSSMTTEGQLFRLEYTGVGGESGFSDLQLVNRRLLAVFKDGIEFSRIITTGLPVNKEVLYNSTIGSLLFDIPIEPGEEIVAIYQLNNQYQTLKFSYTATGGEASVQASAIANKAVYAVLRDGVSASKILSSGTPTDKQVVYDLDGTLTWASELEPNEEITVLYQLN